MANQTIDIGGKKYPFYRTMMSSILLDESEFGQAAINGESIRALCYAGYCLVKGACEREDISFDLSFDAFLKQVEPDLIKKMGSLSDVPATEKKPKAGSSQSGNVKQ